MNFQAIATSADGQTTSTFSFPRSLKGSGSSMSYADLSDPAAGTEGLARSMAPVEMTLPLAASAAPGLAKRDSGATAMAVQDRALGCSSTELVTYTGVSDIVGEIYAGPHAKVDFKYQKGASSELGIGVSSSGSFGTYTASGTSGKSANAEVFYAQSPVNSLKYQKTKFTYAKYHTICVDPYTGIPYYDKYEVKVKGWEGGATSSTVSSAPTATYCHTYQAGGGLVRDTGSAITLTNGLDLTAVGVKLSTKTGFTTNAKTTWTMTANGSLCGSNTNETSSYRVVGK